MDLESAPKYKCVFGSFFIIFRGTVVWMYAFWDLSQYQYCFNRYYMASFCEIYREQNHLKKNIGINLQIWSMILAAGQDQIWHPTVKKRRVNEFKWWGRSKLVAGPTGAFNLQSMETWYPKPWGRRCIVEFPGDDIGKSLEIGDLGEGGRTRCTETLTYNREIFWRNNMSQEMQYFV